LSKEASLNLINTLRRDFHMPTYTCDINNNSKSDNNQNISVLPHGGSEQARERVKENITE
jgi:hypothetical protein